MAAMARIDVVVFIFFLCVYMYIIWCMSFELSEQNVVV